MKGLALTSITDTRAICSPGTLARASSVGGNFADEGLVLADIGTGAGFPGLALKIVRPNLELHLIEQNAKKAAFLSDVVRLLAFDRVYIHRTSYEALARRRRNLILLSLAPLETISGLLKWSADRLEPKSGRVILWLGLDEANRLTSLPGWTMEVAPSDSRISAARNLVGSSDAKITSKQKKIKKIIKLFHVEQSVFNAANCPIIRKETAGTSQMFHVKHYCGSANTLIADRRFWAPGAANVPRETIEQRPLNHSVRPSRAKELFADIVSRETSCACDTPSW